MTRFLGHVFRRTTLLAVLCGAALAGVGLSRWVSFAAVWILVAAGALVCVATKRNMLTLITVALVGLAAGGWRGSGMMHHLALYNDAYGKSVTVIGKANGDAIYGKQTQLSFDLVNAKLADSDVPLAGTIGVSGFGENMLFRGDMVAVTGKLRPGTGSHQAWLSYAQLQVVRHDGSLLERIRLRFNAGMLSALPEPLGSFGMGLLVGQRSGLPTSVSQDLLMVGLVHIIAVSGYNLTIILQAAMRLFGKRSKYQTTLFSVALIGTFLLLTGSSASIVRASIVSLLSLAAWYYGRTFKPVTLILLAAAGTALVNPLYIWGDMGWYLSFLAFYGVMVLGPQIKTRFVPKRFHESLLIGIALESLCAEIMTLPLVLHVFGQMSLVSLPANVLIAVCVPLAMLLSVVAGLAGMFAMQVAGWLAWPAVLLLTYMLDAAHILASIPHIFLQDIGLSAAGMVAMYLAVLFFNLVLHSHGKRNSAIITPENEVPALPYMDFLAAAQPRELST